MTCWIIIEDGQIHKGLERIHANGPDAAAREYLWLKYGQFGSPPNEVYLQIIPESEIHGGYYKMNLSEKLEIECDI